MVHTNKRTKSHLPFNLESKSIIELDNIINILQPCLG